MAPKPAATADVLDPADVDVIAGMVLTRPRSLWAKLKRVWAVATATVSRDEFLHACDKVRGELDGKTVHPEDAARRAKRLIEAYTDAHAQVLMPKCEASDLAIMVAFLGKPQAGFFYSRSLKLLDPRKARK
jgi:hypothetical protein